LTKTKEGPYWDLASRGRARGPFDALGSQVRREARKTHHAAPSTENPIAAAIPSAAKKYGFTDRNNKPR
jgi:hypothetical protein